MLRPCVRALALEDVGNRALELRVPAEPGLGPPGPVDDVDVATAADVRSQIGDPSHRPWIEVAGEDPPELDADPDEVTVDDGPVGLGGTGQHVIDAEGPQELAELVGVDELVLGQGDLDRRRVAKAPQPALDPAKCGRMPALRQERGVEDDEVGPEPLDPGRHSPDGEVQVDGPGRRRTARIAKR